MKILRHILIPVFIAGFIFSLNAQDFEEFKKAERAKYDEFQKERQEELKMLQEEYNDYIEKADREFRDYLAGEWKEFMAFKGKNIPEKPKPVTMPRLDPSIQIEIPDEQLKIALPAPRQPKPEKPMLPLIQRTEPPNFLKTELSVNFYGNSIPLEYDGKMRQITLISVTNKGISDWWEQCSSTSYNYLINQLLGLKNELSLNDFAYLKLLEKVSGLMADGDENESQLYTWFLMLRSGYDAKIALNDNIYLLLPSDNTIYEHSFIRMNGLTYYFLGKAGDGQFQTYEFSFSGAERILDLNVYSPLNIGGDVFPKTVKFKYKGKEYSFIISLNINNIYFYQDYPVTDLSVFFNGIMSREAKESIAGNIMPVIKEMQTGEALNFLLAFVQNAFQYRTDQEQFGKEHFMFPEELFYYPASDCEDRAALFTYLVREMLKLDIIGLEYHDHVATAVHYENEIKGDYIVYNNMKYIVADPTFINAPVGITMPEYKNETASIIRVDNNYYFMNIAKEVWKLTYGSGGRRGGIFQDTKSDSQGNIYLTGYYKNTLNLGGKSFISQEGRRQGFIVKYNKNKEAVWVKNIASDGDATPFSLTFDELENPIITGSFSGAIALSDNRVSSSTDAPDIFTARFDKEGTLQWISKAGLPDPDKLPYVNFVVDMDKNGKVVGTKLLPQNKVRYSTGVFYSNGLITVTGSFVNTMGSSVGTVSLGKTGKFDIVEFLKKENDYLLTNDVDRYIAGLFAVIRLIKSEDMSISGKEVQEALNRYNPHFSESSPEIYKSIGKISIVKNNDGIVFIKTDNGSPVMFNKVKINNGSTLKVYSLENGDEQIEILSGIAVGKLFVWYDLNYIRLYRKNGDMLFDYDTDHTQIVLNVEKDIL
jgi:hypothetical protein